MGKLVGSTITVSEFVAMERMGVGIVVGIISIARPIGRSMRRAITLISIHYILSLSSRNKIPRFILPIMCHILIIIYAAFWMKLNPRNPHFFIGSWQAYLWLEISLS